MTSFYSSVAIASNLYHNWAKNKNKTTKKLITQAQIATYGENSCSNKLLWYKVYGSVQEVIKTLMSLHSQIQY